MNWEAISAVADLIAALAVTISLVYVAVQIHHNTRETRLAAQQSITSDLGRALQVQASTPGLAEIMSRGLENPDALNQTERFQFLSQMGHIFRLYESLHSHHLAGTLDPGVWNGYETAIRDLLSYPGVRSVWDLRCQIYSEGFQQFILEGLSSHAQPRMFGRVGSLGDEVSS